MKVTHVKKARKDQGVCGHCGTPLAAGDPYLHWSFRYGGKHRRCTKPSCAPTRADLTNNEVLQAAYSIADESFSIETYAELVDMVDDVASRIEEVCEMIQEKMSNIESGFGHTDLDIYYELEDQYSDVEAWADEVRSVPDDMPEEDFDPDVATDLLGEAVSECPL